MFITPISKINSIDDISAVNQTAQKTAAGVPFKDIFQSTINNVVETDDNLVKSQYLLSTGQLDDVHTVPIAATKAQLSLDMLIQLRNKALDSYNELMRMNM